jgi:hypothetical protein
MNDLVVKPQAFDINETSPQQAAGYQKEGHWR